MVKASKPVDIAEKWKTQTHAYSLKRLLRLFKASNITIVEAHCEGVSRSDCEGSGGLS
jgi:hypothetical protein